MDAVPAWPGLVGLIDSLDPLNPLNPLNPLEPIAAPNLQGPSDLVGEEARRAQKSLPRGQI
jgi:hypothetical protein